jgi:ribosome biogenesis SPOUT family RNA methylase Rps3
MMIYIIEHIDPEVYDWSLLEYAHISKTVGKENVWFTNVVNEKDREKLKDLGRIETKSVQELGLDSGKMCLLEPKAGGVLTPHDCNEKFEYLIFGGILGDDPPQGRTQKAFAGLDCDQRNLGDVQMSTNTAVLVAKKIADGTQFADITFVDELVIPVEEGEEIILPYRFVVEDGKTVLPEGYIEFVKEKEWD